MQRLYQKKSSSERRQAWHLCSHLAIENSGLFYKDIAPKRGYEAATLRQPSRPPSFSLGREVVFPLI
jgi:hypothetical protein